MYLDFDGFFASVEQLARPHLRGRPVAVVPFEGAENTCVIAVSREAKRLGIQNVMAVREARAICPDLVLVAQSPDLYRRAHNALIAEISAVIQVDAVKSIDELTSRLSPSDRADPQSLGQRIKARLAAAMGPCITCSIGFAANRQLAKMACKAGKPDGNMVWWPQDMPAPLLGLPLSAVPGIGGRMEQRLLAGGITTMAGLLATQPRQLRALWRNVTGERLWYALHGYDVQAPPSERGMYGHGRVLPPGYRRLEQARDASRLLLVKAARRMRRENWNAGRVRLWLDLIQLGGWSTERVLPAVHDDQAVLAVLEMLWTQARAVLPPAVQVMRLGVMLCDLTRAAHRQLDLLENNEGARRRSEKVSAAIDALNRKHGRTLVSVGVWAPPPGGYAGGKISYTRIPSAEDFW